MIKIMWWQCNLEITLEVLSLRLRVSSHGGCQPSRAIKRANKRQTRIRSFRAATAIATVTCIVRLRMDDIKDTKTGLTTLSLTALTCQAVKHDLAR